MGIHVTYKADEGGEQLRDALLKLGEPYHKSSHARQLEIEKEALDLISFHLNVAFQAGVAFGKRNPNM